MSIAGLATYQNRSMYYSGRNGAGNHDLGSGESFMNQMLAFHREDSGIAQTEDGNRTSADSNISSELQCGSVQGVSPIGAYGESKAYTRCITANIKTKEILAHDSDGQTIYSYQEEEKSFSIFINSDGKDKTYTIKGIDENGQGIEEEFDPYNLDPGMMDFPEFSALCMYIRQTDETAGLMSKIAFTDTNYFNSIFEKGDRMPLLKDYAGEHREATPSLAELASKLFDAINEFFEGAAWNKTLSDDKLSMLIEDRDTVGPEEILEELTPLGMGFAIAGGMGYGMSASLATTNAADDVIVRVNVAKGGGSNESIDVNLSKFDPKNATAVEMFAYCQYKDAMGRGSGHKWGSWNGIKSIISPVDGMNFGSLDKIMNEKRNWTGALAKSKTHLENGKTGETLSAADLMKVFEEQIDNAESESEKDKDWRTMSDEDWNRLLNGVDTNIQANKSDDTVKESVVIKHNEYHDPKTDRIVPVEIKYTTSYSDTGISCMETTDADGKVSNRELWSIEYANPGSYTKIQNFLKSFSEDQRPTFATQEKFWEDFMKDGFDVDGFRAYYDSTDNGYFNIERAKAEGKTLRDMLTEPYAEYINNTSFIGHVWTEQEMWENWNAQIEANQKTLANGRSGMAPRRDGYNK